MSKVSFRELLGAPGVISLVISQLYARFPFGMLSLAFVIHIQAVTGSYAVAGIALGAETIGASISGPVLGRMMARFGVRKVVALATLVTVSAFLAMALVPPDPLTLILLGLLVGLSSPPIQPAARTIYPMITPKKLLQSLYTLDATAQEILWVVGPLLATILAAQFGNLVMIYSLAVIQVTGTAWFLANKSVATAKIPRSESKVGKVLKNPNVTAVTLLGLLFVGSFAGIEVGAVAMFDKTVAGALIAVFSLGSFIGGFWLGPKIRGKYALTIYLGIVLTGFGLIFLNPQNPLWMGISLLIAGLGVAPALGYLSLWIAQGTKPGETAEAYGWTTTGQLVGFSAGSALSGIAIDTISAESALFVSLIFAIATLLASLLVQRR